MTTFLSLLAALVLPMDSLKTALHDQDGAFVLIDCSSGETQRYNPELSAEKLPPCSTFKIWNTAIGLEAGILTTPDAPFWKWDGKKRFLDAWNKDQTLREAFSVSCVPAYQQLARDIGEERMQAWLKKIGYGDQNISSGIDVFWLPAKDRTPLLVSADEQAELIRKLVTGKLPFSGKTLAVLTDVMTARQTDKGTLYGKTGTDMDEEGKAILGWFVGYVQNADKIYAFAAVSKAPGTGGREVRAVVESTLEEMGLL